MLTILTSKEFYGIQVLTWYLPWILVYMYLWTGSYFFRHSDKRFNDEIWSQCSLNPSVKQEKIQDNSKDYKTSSGLTYTDIIWS